MDHEYENILIFFYLTISNCQVQSLCFYYCDITSRKWLTVAIFRKWQDSSVALWIEIAVIEGGGSQLAWMTGIDDWHGGLAWMTGKDEGHG